MSSLVPALAARVRQSPGTPLVTYVDQARSERTELSATTLANAAAKIANALRDAYDLEPGALVALLLPLHWQLAAWLAGSWTAGMIVTTDASPSADLVVTTPDRAAAVTGDVAVVSLHPFGLPLTDPLPPNAHDVTITIRQQPDAYLFDTPESSAPALRIHDTDLSSQEVWLHAASLASAWGLEHGGRLLATGSALGLDAVLAVSAVPLVAAASVVIAVPPVDVEAISNGERVTASAALPR